MTTRISRISLLALAATATVAMTALAPTTASAWGRFGGYHRAVGWHGGLYHFNHYGLGYRHTYGWGRYHYPYRWWGWYRWYRWYPRPIVYGAVGAVGGAAVAAAPAMSAPAPAAQPASCLVKQYLQNGAVAFADRCTNEQAVAMPNGGPQGQPGPGAQ